MDTAHYVIVITLIALTTAVLFCVSVITHVATVDCPHGYVMKKDLKSMDTCDVSLFV